MKNLIFVLFVVFLVGCGNNIQNDSVILDNGGEANNQIEAPIQVVATFSIIADMVEQVGGDLVEVYSIVPVGEIPEYHEVLPSDMIIVTNADLIFFNGLNLETGGNWFVNLMSATDRVFGVHYFLATEGITPFYLTTEGLESYTDPHAWLDLRNGIIYIQNITRVLSEFSPENAHIFEYNADQYIEMLYALHNEWLGSFDDIPDSQRLLVTSEGAFRYFAETYNLNVAYIWELNSEDEGTPEQMINIINIVNNSDVLSLFYVSSIEVHYMQQVSAETGVLVYGMLFAESLSEVNEGAHTYYYMMRHNFETINSGLRGLW